jgi:OmcA/MtrC family decaheme c-type cytochrome
MKQQLYLVVRITAFVALIVLCLTGQTKKHQYSPREKAFYADPALVDFVRPGLVITINSASISSTGAIGLTYTLTDPSGLPLDATGATTPGAVSLTYIASYIPKGQKQYVAYTTAQATGKVLGTITRPNFEEGGGTLTSVGPGQYQYTLKAQAPAGFDPTLTTTVAVVGSRDLTSFNLGTSYAGNAFNFVPNGSPVTVTRDVIRTESCNTCHDQLAFHGGHAVGLQMCVLCHQPQNADPTTGNTLDATVLFHKIHMGSQLPSVVGTSTAPGVPYQIAGYMGAISDFSTVIDPADPRRCGVCHSQTASPTPGTGVAPGTAPTAVPAQAKAFLTEPSRAACGACHDDVNFASGANHPGGFQTDDTQCMNCHIPQGETPFDASIMGAHVVANDTPATYPQNPDTLISSIKVTITAVTNTNAGQKPVVAYTVKDMNGKPISLNDPTLEDIQFTLAGPTTDYGSTSFGSDVTTPGYVGEDGTQGKCDASGNCTYTFQHAIPAGATGTYAIGVESERLENVLTGTNSAQQVESGTPNQVFYFSVDGSAVQLRRTVVAETNCNQCHVHLVLHGNRRNDPEYCVLCHNPSNTDASQRVNATVAADKAAPPQSITFPLMVHRIHDGVNMLKDGGSYTVVGFGGSSHDFSTVLYPAMSPAGSATYTQNCAMCHVNGSEANLPVGLNNVVNPQGWINPEGATATACSGCHVAKDTASHFLAMTTSLGESCTVCHQSGAAFDVDKVHAQ